MTGEVVGTGNGFGDGLPGGEDKATGVGNAKVGNGEGDAVGDSSGEGVARGVGVEVGIRSGQRCSATVAPPISLTSFSQRAPIFFKSGGPNGISAVPGKIRYVTLRSLIGRLLGVARALICCAIRNEASPTLSLGPTSPTIAG